MTPAVLSEIRYHAVREQLAALYPTLARSTRFRRMVLTFCEDDKCRAAGQAWKDGVIEINLACFVDYPNTMIREVVPHEIAHVAAHILYGEKGWGHRPGWKRIMADLGLPPMKVPCWENEERNLICQG